MQARRARLVLAAALLLGVSGALFLPAVGRTFVGPDDWLRIDQAAGLLAGEPGALSAVLRGPSPLEALRPSSLPLWMLDHALHGLDTGAYYATNLLGLQAAALCVLLLAARLCRSAAGGLAAAAWFALNPATAQPLTFLAARDDLLAALLCLVLAVAWPRLRSSAAGLLTALALYALALGAKVSALPAPLLLLALDAAEGVGATWWRGPRRWLWGPGFLAVAALYGSALVALAGAEPLLRTLAGSPEAAGRGAGAVATGLGRTLLVPALDLPHGGGPPWLAALPLLPVAAAAALAIWRRSPGGRLLAFAGAWLALTLLPQLPFLAAPNGMADAAGRYLLLPSVGTSLLVGAAVAGAPVRLRGMLAAALLAAGATVFAASTQDLLRYRDPSIQRLLGALDEAFAASPRPTLLIAGLQRADDPLAWMLSSPVLQRRYPGLTEPPRWFAQGSDAVLQAVGRSFARGTWGPSSESVADALRRPGALLLTDNRLGVLDGGTRSRPEAGGSPRSGPLLAGLRPWPVLRGPVSPAPVDGVVEALDLGIAGEAWTAHRCGPSRARPGCEAGGGWILTSGRTFEPDEYVRVIPTVPPGMPALLLSPTLDVDPIRHCTLEVDATARPEPGERGATATIAVGWSSTDDDAWAFERGILLPLALDGIRRKQAVPLGDVLGWTGAGTVRRVAVLGPDRPASVALHGLRLTGCAGALAPP